MCGRIWRKIITTIFKLFNWKKFRSSLLYDIPRIYYIKRLELGEMVSINNNVFIHAVGGVRIGNNCVLSVGTTILSTGENIEQWINRSVNEDIHVNAPVNIGNNVWLCANTTICAGVTIADNSVVAAGSVVTKDLSKPGALYAGVPAKYIRDLSRENE